MTYGKVTLEYEIDLKEVREDDPYLREHNGQREKLERLERILRSIYYFLQTPLMVEVAKADKLKPPVTKTNVLRMDKNFKEVVALYDYITAYDRDGFNRRGRGTAGRLFGQGACRAVHGPRLAALLPYL